MKKRTRRTKYSALLSAKKRVCKGGKMAAFNKAATAYVKDAVKKGNKTKAQAEAVVRRLKNQSCPVVPKTKTTRRKKRA